MFGGRRTILNVFLDFQQYIYTNNFKKLTTNDYDTPVCRQNLCKAHRNLKFVSPTIFQKEVFLEGGKGLREP